MIGTPRTLATHPETDLTAASTTRSLPRSRARVTPIATLGVAVVALAASAVFAAAAIVLLSALVSFPVAVPIHDGEAMGGSGNPWWWLDALGAFLCGGVAIAAVVEAIRLVRSGD